MRGDQDDGALWLQAAMTLACETIVRDVSERLTPLGLEVMPLKGIYLQKTVYREAPERRQLSDVDLLVTPAGFRAAHGELVAAGYIPIPGMLNAAGCTYESPWRAHLDLHCALYDGFVFRVSTEGLFERGLRDARLFDAPVCLPDPLDLYAHLVGHFAKGRLRGNHRNLRDLHLTAAHFGLAVPDVVLRLTRGGLQRAARYVLPLSAERFADGFALEVMASLPPDAVGERCARVAHAALNNPDVPWLAQVVGAHLLNTSLPRALLSFGDGTIKWIRREASTRCASAAR